ERDWNEQRLHRRVAIERVLEALVEDALVRRVHVDEHQTVPILREDVDAMQLRERETERVLVFVGEIRSVVDTRRYDPLAEKPGVKRRRLAGCEREGFLCRAARWRRIGDRRRRSRRGNAETFRCRYGGLIGRRGGKRLLHGAAHKLVQRSAVAKP